MMKIQKSILTLCLMLVLILQTTATIHASESDTAANHSAVIPKVINQYMDAINNKDWNLFVNSHSPDRQDDYISFPSQNQRDNRTGILSVDSIQIYAAKKLPSTHITQIEPHFKEINTSLYDDIQYYYIGFDYEVNKESEFFYNGIRYELFAIGSINKTEYIIGREIVYEKSALDAFGYSFNSESEEKAQNIVDQRKRGLIVNFNNETISSNFDKDVDSLNKNVEPNKQGFAIGKEPNSTGDELLLQPSSQGSATENTQELNDLELASEGQNNGGFQTFSATSTPSTIKLYIISTAILQNIGFDNYAKQVLPNEWFASWETEALRAGAIAIKGYAWYNATYPRSPATDYGAHLTDRWQNYQHFVAGSNHPNSDSAVDDVSGIFMRNSDGEVFDARYSAGTLGDIGTAFGGELKQWGTQYIATNYPSYDYYTILSYYYSFSDKSSGYIQTGNY